MYGTGMIKGLVITMRNLVTPNRMFNIYQYPNRKASPVDLAKIEESLLSLSTFLEAHTEVRELDLNPIFVYEDGLLAVDARVILEEK